MKDEKGGDTSSFITNGEWQLIGMMKTKYEYRKHEGQSTASQRNFLFASRNFPTKKKACSKFIRQNAASLRSVFESLLSVCIQISILNLPFWILNAFCAHSDLISLSKGVPGERNEEFYDCCPEPYVDITYQVSKQGEFEGLSKRRFFSVPDSHSSENVVLLLQPDRALRADQLDGLARLHPPAGFGREAHLR